MVLPRQDVSPEVAHRFRWLDLAVGVSVGLLILIAGAIFVARMPATYEASASVLVLPDQGLTPQLLAGYYDTLNQGQVVNTFAEVLRLRTVGSGLSAAPSASTRVSVVPNTAVIQITGSAPTSNAAVQAADKVLDSSALYVDQAYAPYRIALVHRADGTAHRVGLGPLPVLAVVALVAIVAGLVLHQAVRALRGESRFRSTRPSAENAPRLDVANQRDRNDDQPSPPTVALTESVANAVTT